MMIKSYFRFRAKDNRLHNADRMILDYLMSCTDFESFTVVVQRNIAEETQLIQPNVARSLKKLKKYGYIEVEKQGKHNSYKLNLFLKKKI